MKMIAKEKVFRVSNGGALKGGSISDVATSSLAPGMMALFSSLLERYSNLLQISPYPTKIITSAFLGGLGDTLIQNLERRKLKKAFDFRRLVVFMLVTGLYIAPVIHNWFGFLDSMPFLVGLSHPVKAGIMMLTDQTLGAVGVTIGFFYAFEFVSYAYIVYFNFSFSNSFRVRIFKAQSIVPSSEDSILETKRPFYDLAYETCKNCLWKTLVANWYCWPVINYINFLFVPSHYRYFSCDYNVDNCNGL
jgi:hypothetical protein